MKTMVKQSMGVVACFWILGVLSCSQSDTTESPTAEASDSPSIPVAVTPLTTGLALEAVQAWGTVHPWQEAKILAGISGTVTLSPVRRGQSVPHNQLLLEIDPTLYRARVDEAAARVTSAEIGERRAKSNLDRATTLREDDKISDTEMETSAYNHAKAVAETASARAGLELAEINLRNARPIAPFNGLVANRVPDAGTSVNSGELLVHLVDLSRVLLTAEVSEQDLSRITNGTSATVRVEGIESPFEGTVRGLGPQADPDSRQFPIELEVQNPNLILRGGMIAKVEIVIHSYKDVPLLPVESLVERAGRLGFYVVKGDKAEWRDAVFGPRTKTHISILEGAKAQESVVILGQTRLNNGSTVHIEPTP